MKTLEPLLAKHPFFEGLEQPYVELITGCASNIRIKAGEFLFREGEDARQFFVIREGTVNLEMFVPGRGPVTVQTVEEGDIVGWSWLFPPHRWYNSGRAATPLRLFAFDGHCLREKCEQDHHLGYELMKRFSRIVVERLQETRLQLIDLYKVH
jgi:CRP-like cAMP-binding protein